MSQLTLGRIRLLPLAWLALLGPASAQTFLEQRKLVPSDIGADDRFGGSVSLSGDTALVGAVGNGHGGTHGAAYVFVRSGATWTEQAKLVASDGGSGLGNSVSLSGDTALVGARSDDHSTGSAYVFVRNGTTWTEQAKLLSSLPVQGEHFGTSVALSGDTAVVGAISGGPGSAYVFVRNGTAWTLQARLLAWAGEEDDFGTSVALSGETVVVGAGAHFIASDTGSAYVFVRTGTTWTEQAKLVPSDGLEAGGFGAALSLWGDTVIIGASAHEHSGIVLAGAAYVFVRDGTTWTEQGKLIASDAEEHDQFGVSISLVGDLVAIGFNPASDTRGDSAFVFVRNGTNWTEHARPIASDWVPGDRFSEVSLDGDTLIVGAYEDEHCLMRQGSVYVFGPEAGPPHPNLAAADPSPIEVLIPGTAQTITLTGTRFDLVTQLLLDCAPIDPARYTIVSPSLITLDMPQTSGLGAHWISVTDGGYSDALRVWIQAARLPLYELGNGDPFNVIDRDDGLAYILAGPVGSVQYLFASRSNVPSILNYLDLDIGNQFTELCQVGRFVIPASGWLRVTVPSSSLMDPGSAGLILYSQAIWFRWPSHLPVSNLQSIQLIR